MYKVIYYAPDCGGAFAIPPAVHGEKFSTIEEARAAIQQELGGKTFGRSNPSLEEGYLEAWRDSEAEDCGTFAISKA